MTCTADWCFRKNLLSWRPKIHLWARGCYPLLKGAWSGLRSDRSDQSAPNVQSGKLADLCCLLDDERDLQLMVWTVYSGIGYLRLHLWDTDQQQPMSTSFFARTVFGKCSGSTAGFRARSTSAFLLVPPRIESGCATVTAADRVWSTLFRPAENR